MNPTTPAVAPLDADAMAATAQRWSTRAIPPGALGRLQPLAVQLSGMTGVAPPTVVANPAVAVFAADHGVVADGASAWPSSVTQLMAATMVSGGAAINQFAALFAARVVVVDVGMANPAPDGVVSRRVRAGTGSLARGPAMSTADAAAALAVGIEVANSLVDEGADCLVGGEMGIGNTTAAAAVISVICNIDSNRIVGPGAGLGTDQLDHKRALVAAGVARVPADASAITVLAEVGGLEIAALAGFYLGAAARRIPVIVDGVIALAAACTADRLDHAVRARLIAGHRSTEPAADVALGHLDLTPLIELDLRLGEGTGACLAIPFLQAAARAVRDIADLPTSF